MRKFPQYSQLDSMDCVATCLRMVAKFYGKSYPLSLLKERCHTRRNGVSMLGISDAAESIGFRTAGVKITLEQLATEVTLPCIMHWNQKHFVVLYDVKLTIEANKVTAIVGTSGSGKTTMLKLLLGFYAPIEGQVLLRDIALSRYSDSVWRSRCGVVMQEGYIFSDTIAGYIAEVTFPSGMQSTYKEQLKLIQQMDGTGDIITYDQRLIERFIQPIRAIFDRAQGN